MSCNDSTKEDVGFFGMEEIATKMPSLTVRDDHSLFYVTSDSGCSLKKRASNSECSLKGYRNRDGRKLDARRSATFCEKKRNSIRSGNIKPYETCRLDRVMCRWKISMVKSTVPFTLIQRITCTMATMADADVSFTRDRLVRKDGIDKLPSMAKHIVGNIT